MGHSDDGGGDGLSVENLKKNKDKTVSVKEPKKNNILTPCRQYILKKYNKKKGQRWGWVRDLTDDILRYI